MFSEIMPLMLIARILKMPLFPYLVYSLMSIAGNLLGSRSHLSNIEKPDGRDRRLS